MSVVKENVNVGGIQTAVYKSGSIRGPSVAVAFLLHGRTGSAEDVDSFARTLVETANSGSQLNSILYVVAFVPLMIVRLVLNTDELRLSRIIAITESDCSRPRTITLGLKQNRTSDMGERP